ncbi:MAG: hypothetical protein ACJATI_004833 [Halioglobus sp.]|jgi:hypothetical protein
MNKYQHIKKYFINVSFLTIDFKRYKMKKFILYGIIVGFSTMLNAQSETKTNMQESLPYYQIEDAPETFTAASVTARMIDGLGYRYYWATEGLRDEDLAYNPGNDGKICSEVLEHIAELSNMILTAVHREVNGTRKVPENMTWQERRSFTLNNLKEISDQLRATGDVSECKIIFKRGEETSEFPFWNLINGPIADAIYHTGQIVSFRRSAGNPSDPNVNVLRGKNRESK